MELYDVRLLPPKAVEVARVIGVEATVKVLLACTSGKKRGEYVYVPKSFGKRSRKLEGVIGRECLERLMRVYGGDRIFLSSKRELLVNWRIAGIIELRRAGFSAADVAGVYGVSDVYVHMLTGAGGGHGGYGG